MTEVEAFITREAEIPGYLERVMLADDPLMAQFHLSKGLAGIRTNQLLRERVIERFGYAVLTQDAVARLLPYGPFVEIGAGTGYWSYELRKAGCISIATDLHTVATKSEPEIRHPFHGRAQYVDVIAMSAEDAAQKYSEKSLLMVWPDLNLSWAFDALRKYTGDTLVYVGDGRGRRGWTGDSQLHDEIERAWVEKDRITIPRFPVHHDAIFIYKRK